MQNDCCDGPEVLQWNVQREGHFQVCGQTTEQLPAGGYSCETDNCGRPLFVRRQLASDELIRIPGSLAAEIVAEVNDFWPRHGQYSRFGFLHRRGYLFYGKQGGGKTSVVHQIVADAVAAGNLAFFCGNPWSFLRCLTQFRKVEPHRPLVCVFEDIDAIIEEHGDADILQWLDGNHQVDRVINLASTNYPEKLERRIVARPRRFDRVLRIDSPCALLREAYLARKLPNQTPQQREHWVEETAGFTFAALSELIIAVYCMDGDFCETVERLRQLDSHNPSSEEFAANAAADGFASDTTHA